MTTHLADQERTCRRAPADAADDSSSCDEARMALDMSIERKPDPDAEDLSAEDALWPERLRRIIRASLTHWRRPDLIPTAELLLTELATNALRHGQGLDIGVHVYLRDDRLVFEVNDGSPIRPKLRHAAPTDEGGRGLLLVEALSEEWGVSEDGTTTWCTLPLGPAPISREVSLELPADRSAMNRARVNGRTLLTLLGWPGRQNAAIDVLYVLVHNAVQHALTPGKTGQRLDVWFRVTTANELHIDVTDPNPAFLNFEEAVAGGLGRGLWGAQQLGASITYFPADGGKTVRATMRPGRAEL